MPQKRLDYLDMAKGIGIFLVILGHIEFIQESTLRWLSSFHMPLFFVVGGFLFFRKQDREQKLKDYLRNRAKLALIPYASFSLIFLTMAAIDGIISPKAVARGSLARDLIDAVTGYGLGVLWFLTAYFLAFVFFFLLDRFTGRLLRDMLIVLLAAGAMWISRFFGLNHFIDMKLTLGPAALLDLGIVFLRAFLSLPFVLFGWYLAKAEIHMQKRMVWLPVLLLIPGWYLAEKLPVFDLHYLYAIPANYAAAACTCAGLLALLRLLPAIPGLTWLGRNSLVIMCTHTGFLVVYYIAVGLAFVRKFIPMTQPVYNVFVALAVCAAEIPIVWFFNRYLRHLLGRTV